MVRGDAEHPHAFAPRNAFFITGKNLNKQIKKRFFTVYTAFTVYSLEAITSVLNHFKIIATAADVDEHASDVIELD